MYRDLGWEEIAVRAEFLGLSMFHNIHLYNTRPLIRTCMPSIKCHYMNSRLGGQYTPFPFLSAQYNNSFFPYYTKLWNNLERSIKNEPDIKRFKNVLKTKLKPKKHRHYNFGKKHPNTLLCRLRVGRSFLNSHSFSIGHSDTDLC